MKRCVKCESRFAARGWDCPSCGFSPETQGGIPVLAPDLAREIGGYETALFDTHGGAQAEQSFWTAARAALIRSGTVSRKKCAVFCGTPEGSVTGSEEV